MNEVSITGRVIEDFKYSHTSYGEDFYTLKISCGRSTGTRDEVLLMISDRLVDVEVSLLNEYAIIEGEIRTNNILGDDNKKHLLVYVFVHELSIMNMSSFDTIDVNEINIEGTVCINKGLRITPNGRKITDISLAVNRECNRSNYIPVIFWGRNAENADNLPIGAKITVSGRLQSRTYIKDDNEHTVYELSAQCYK